MVQEHLGLYITSLPVYLFASFVTFVMWLGLHGILHTNIEISLENEQKHSVLVFIYKLLWPYISASLLLLTVWLDQAIFLPLFTTCCFKQVSATTGAGTGRPTSVNSTRTEPSARE